MLALVAPQAALVAIRAEGRADAREIEAGIRAHCRRLHCSDSTTTAAINFGLRSFGSTIHCANSGKARADQLHARDLASVAPTPA